jgi:hypothetical protein
MQLFRGEFRRNSQNLRFLRCFLHWGIETVIARKSITGRANIVFVSDYLKKRITYENISPAWGKPQKNLSAFVFK